MPNRLKSLGAATAATLATGLCFVLSTDLGTMWPLVFIAPIPLLLFAFRSKSVLTVVLAAFCARVIGAAGIAIAYGDVFPPLPLVLAFAVLGCQFTLVVLATRWANRQLPQWATPITFASCTVALEFLWSLHAPHGSFGSLGYSLIDALPVVQVASIGGLAMVGFIAALLPASISVLMHQPRHWRTFAAIGAIPVALSAAFGLWRLSQPYEAHTRVGLAAIDSLTAQSFGGGEPAHEVAREYDRLLQRFRGLRVTQIVLPERIFLVNPNDTFTTDLLQTAANTLPARIVAGFDDTGTAGEHRNTAHVFTPDASPRVYAKRKLVPGLELLTPGDRPLVFDERGVAICKDMDFPALFREYGNGGARLLLVPAWDFVRDGRLHSRMAIMRGIENGFAIARAAATGRLTVSDAYGRIIAEAVTSRAKPVTLVADVGLTTSGTVYSRVGDVFAWITVLMSIGLLGCCALARMLGRTTAHSPLAMQEPERT